MVTAMDAEFSRGFRVGSRLDVFDVSTIDPDWNVMLRFACNCTGMATYAGSIVDDKAIVDHVETSQ